MTPKEARDLFVNFTFFYVVVYSLFIIPYILFINEIISYTVIFAYIIAVLCFVILWLLEKWGVLHNGDGSN